MCPDLTFVLAHRIRIEKLGSECAKIVDSVNCKNLRRLAHVHEVLRHVLFSNPTFSVGDNVASCLCVKDES